MKQIAVACLAAFLGTFSAPTRADEAATNEAPPVEAPERASLTSAGNGSGKLVYVIPVHEMIEPALTYVVRRGLDEARAQQASALVFSMDTHGGRLDATEEIIRLIDKAGIPTYTFVEHNAISAGAIIALSTDHIYMAPGSKIGDAMPIMMTPTGGAEAMPEDLKEKQVSFVAGMIRAVAQENGHDPKLAEKMVRMETEYRIGDTVIAPSNQLLTLTNEEAERMVGEGDDQRRLLSRGTVKDIPAMLDEVDLAGARIVQMEVTDAERVARWIAALAPFFLMAGLLGIYIEMKTPGFGIPGILGLCSLAIFFWGHHIAGLAGMEEVLFFIAGVVLILIELLLFPGTAIFGILGASLIIWALLAAMIDQLPGEPWYPSFPDLQKALINLTTGIVMAGVGGALAGRYLPKTRTFNKLVLSKSTSSQSGYTATAPTTSLIGQEGVAVTALRPGGGAMFGDRRLDVVTRGEFLDAGTPLVVVEAHGMRIVVEARKSGGTP